ncbi:alanyl-tRNA editing protein [Marivivens donghaensis]|jgi:misacylated tRNA(Ala) deacylase|uniref:alanyl-tRNA editing protein n=1 Tax=Marivivens donghaensis TaxID=1699413 RepID=UPI003F69FED8
MTQPLFRDDAYCRSTTGTVTSLTEEGGIVLDATIFYPTAGGQPGDSGQLTWDGGQMKIATTIKGEGDDIVLVPAEPAPLPPVGTVVTQEIQWDRRYRLMRVHTALHLLSVVIPLPVTGGSIGVDKGRLDFDMPEAPSDKEALEAALNDLIAGDHRVTDEYITDAELDANPELVKTMSVQPPRGSGRIRLVRIGEGEQTVDLQPCGGTNVAWTSEIGAVRIGKIEKKGAQNRRVSIHIE